MSNSPYPIELIPLPAHPDPAHPIPLRREVTDLVNDPDASIQVSLFLQALDTFMKMSDLNDQTTYFRIAAIHGAPYVDWNGAKSPGNWEPEIGSNFCNHNRVTFGTWHRPYVMLFERRLYDIMGDIVKQKTGNEKAVWSLERERWRLPYWDWGTKQSYIDEFGLPAIATLQKLPNYGGPNPFYTGFKNPVLDSNKQPAKMGDTSVMGKYAIPNNPVGFNWSECRGTSRHAPSSGPPFEVGTNDWQKANAEFKNPDWLDEGTGSIGDMVGRLFSYDFSTYGSFVSTRFHPNLTGSDYLSLEYIHNNIHMFTGGATPQECGQMGDIPVATYDPLFWLHHSMVDKLHDNWCTLHPDQWFNDANLGQDTATSPLIPFYKNSTTNFISNDVRYSDKLNYSYEAWKGPAPRTGKDLVNMPTAERRLANLKHSINFQYGTTRRLVLEAGQKLAGLENDYIINVVYNRHAFDRSYAIHFFLGDVESEVSVNSLTKHKNHIGLVYAFGGSGFPCENCSNQKAKGVLSKGQVILTIPLIQQAKSQSNTILNDLTPQNVNAYVRQHLSWKVVKNPGEIVPTEQLTDLKVLVMKGRSEHSPDDLQLSKYYNYEPMWECTETKVGGARREHTGLWAPQHSY